MIQIEHYLEVDDVGNFGVDVGNGQDRCGVIVCGADLLEQLNSLYYCFHGVLTKDTDMNILNGDMEG